MGLWLVPASAAAIHAAPLRNLNFEQKQLCRRNRDRSHANQRDRERVLDLVTDQDQSNLALAAAQRPRGRAWTSRVGLGFVDRTRSRNTNRVDHATPIRAPGEGPIPAAAGADDGLNAMSASFTNAVGVRPESMR